MANRLSFSIAVNLLTENFKKGTSTVKDSLRSVQMQIITFAAALGFAGLNLSNFVSKLIEVARTTARAITALKNVSGTAGKLADNLKFVNDMAGKYGLEINALISNYAKFAASAQISGMALKDQRAVFESVSRSVTAFGLSADEANGVFLALSQMMSKGKISSEELRLQMGERLPVALQAMAKAAGTTVAGLDKLLKQGKLMSADILPKFADALNEMIPNVDTDTMEGSINRLSNAFTKFTQSTGIQDKYKSLIEGVTTLVQVAGENIKNIIVGIVASIVFVVTSSLTKVYQGYATTGKQIVANATTTHNQLRAAIAARVQAEIALDKAKSAAFFASEKQRLQTVTAVRNAEKTLSARVAAETKAHEAAKAAAANAAAIRSRGAWATSFATISGSIKKLGASLRSMWSAFAPALIISAIVAVLGYFKNLYDEAKRIKNIFSEYRKEASNIGGTQEIAMLQAQLKLVNEKVKGTKDHNDAVSQLRKMLSLEKGDHKDLNSLVAQRVKLLREAARAEFYSSKIPEAESKMRDLARNMGMSLSEATGFARNHDFETNMGRGKAAQDLAKIQRANGTAGILGYVSLSDMEELNQNLKIWDDANEQLKKSLSSTNTVSKDPFVSYSQQIENAKDNISSLKKELEDLKKGVKPASVKDGDQFDFAKGIEDKTKELKDERDRLSYLINGTSTSSMNKAESAAEKARKAAQKSVDDQLKLNNDKAKAGLEARNQELDNQQKILDLQEDGFDKEQAQNRLNYEKSILAADKYAQDLLETRQKAERDDWDIKNPNGSKTPFKTSFKGISSLSDQDQSNIIKQQDIANQELKKSNADLLKNLLEKYQDYATRKAAIEKQYNKDVQVLESNRTSENSDSINKAITELQKQKKEATSNIDLESFKESIKWDQVFGDLDKVSTQTLGELRDKLRQYLVNAGDSISIQDLKAVSEAIDNIDEKLNVKSPFASLVDGFKDLSAAGNDAAKQILAYRKISNSLSEVMTYADSLTQAFSDLADIGIFSEKDANNLKDITGYLQGSATASAGLGKVLSGDMSGIQDMISGTTQMIKSVSSLFGNGNKALEDTEQLQKITEKIDIVQGSINRLLEKRIVLINKATAAEAGYLNALTQEAIKQQQGYVQGMFDRLSGNEIFGKKGKNNNLTLTALMDKEGLTSIEDFIKWWNEDGGVQKLTMEGYDLKNEDQWQSIVDSWTNLEDAMQSATDAANEAMTGITFDELKDSLDDLVKSTDTTFEDIQKSFEDHMSDAVMNFVKRQYLNDALENWYKKFAEAYSDDVLSSAEVSELQNMYNEAYNKAQNMYDDAMKAAGVDTSSSSSTQKASSGYSTSMDQETGAKIEGRMTGMQMNLISLDATTQEIMKSALTNSGILANMSFSLKSLEIDSAKSIFYLEDIATNTKPLPQMKQLLEKIEKNTRDL